MAKDSIEESQTEIEAVPLVSAGAAGSMPEALPIPIDESTAEEILPGERSHIVKAATLVMLGNLGSSVMGMVRQQVVASFGQSIASPFISAITPAQTFNDFLINGSINGALVPTFNDYAAPEKREALRRLVFTLVNLVFLVMLAATIVFLFIAPWFISNIQVRGYTPQEKLLTTQFARIIFFSLLALGPFAVLQAALFARKEFGWPAVATAAYHIGIIIGAIIGALAGDYFLGTYGLA
ncbi:MAG TPA: lipid II flippase MurJ, partial [Ktedonobacteraceae bacterium]